MVSLLHLRNSLLAAKLARFSSLSHFPLLLSVQKFHTNPNNDLFDYFDHLLQRCCTTNTQRSNLDHPVKQIHAQIVLTSSFSSAFLSARLISVYSKLSLLNDAHKVFDTSPKVCLSNSFFWNSILRANVSFYRYRNVVELYGRMRELNIHPDGFGFPLILKAIGMTCDVRVCKIVHCHVIHMGFGSRLHVCNEMLGMYGDIGLMEVAFQVFERMYVRTRVSWNIMMSGFAKNCDCDGALTMLHRMENEGYESNSVTWTSLISSFSRCGRSNETWEYYVLMRIKGIDATAESVAVVLSVCAGSELNVPNKGEILHGHVITAGFEKYVFVRNALISMYGRNSAVKEAEYLFSKMESKSTVSWNSLISAYAQSGLCDEALSAFQLMINLDKSSTVKPNVFSWTALINGFAASGRPGETLQLFRQMQFAQVLANAITVAGVLSACAELSALTLGRGVHAHTIKKLMDCENLVTNSLINMYMKCGSLVIGNSIFQRTAHRDLTSWNSMITGYGMHGLGESALRIFHQLVNEGVKPDEVTFVAILSACSHAGLVTEGLELFENMTKVFHIQPLVEHYSCMVDLFGRAGLMQEAGKILKSMPMEPNVPVWGALLNSCKMHQNGDYADETASQIFNTGSEVMGSYMLLSHFYAESGRWDDSSKVRLSAQTRGLKKIPGQSWIEVKKKVCSFSAGRSLNMEIGEIREVVENLNQMVTDSYLSDRNFGPHAADNEAYAF